MKGEVPLGERTYPYQIRLSSRGGVVDDFVLSGYRERGPDNLPAKDSVRLANQWGELSETDRIVGQVGALRFGRDSEIQVPADAVYEELRRTDREVSYRYRTPEGAEIERSYRLDPETFLVEMGITVRNRSSRPQSHRLALRTTLRATQAMEKGDGFLSKFVPPPDHLNALCHADGDVEREPRESLKSDGAQVFRQEIGWVAIDRQYFASAIVVRAGLNHSCRLFTEGEMVAAELEAEPARLEPGEEKRYAYTAFLGVKKPEFMAEANADLEDAIDYNIMGLDLSAVCAVLLKVLGFFHGWFNSWGLAILALTVLVKLILFPLNQKQGKSMQAMQALKPEIDALKEKYGDDKQRQNEEMMRLWREHGVNPAGGCMPVLVQMPIWFALYRSLSVSVDLYQEGFLWMPDLTARDPLWILPVALVIVMFLQQKMMPTSMDAAQQKIMLYTMPLMFGAMMAALPAGLCFYIFVNTLLTIVQQQFIKKTVGSPGAASAKQAVSS